MLHKAIPPSVAALLKEICLLPLPNETYMAGGTALAIYLGHRVSVDIDLFTQESFFCGPIISEIKKAHEIIVENAAERDTFVAEVDRVRVSLFRYPYPLLEPLTHNPHYDILLASPIDIASMKVVAIMQRGTARDFIDLKALISAYNFTLEYLMTKVQEKYGVSKDYSYQVKRGLVFFDDAIKGLGDVAMVKNGEGVRMERKEWDEVEGFFKRLIFH